MAKQSWISRALVGACALAAWAVITPAVAQAPFPFEREMVLDAKRLPDSKRVPMLEIFEDGRATIDLWCKSGEGRAEVTGDAIKFTLGPMREEYCTPERLQRDEELAAWLTAVTSWRLAEDDVLVLIGPTELNYRLSTH
jgi:heat shock protein HslJ